MDLPHIKTMMKNDPVTTILANEIVPQEIEIRKPVKIIIIFSVEGAVEIFWFRVLDKALEFSRPGIGHENGPGV